MKANETNPVISVYSLIVGENKETLSKSITVKELFYQNNILKGTVRKGKTKRKTCQIQTIK